MLISIKLQKLYLLRISAMKKDEVREKIELKVDARKTYDKSKNN